jgi:ADP-ribose pyrophosphatase YjhB (NUDIX family)
LSEYEHPDAAAIRAVAELGIEASSVAKLSHIESFRGRRGWHVMFNYLVRVEAEIDAKDAQWFDAKQLPPTAHGDWEKGVIAKALSES